ncbi:hypothetical protein Smp_175700 [Schistosoma mansoni]|uniref:hypothetical protein n=1 Tax=Schistosoma mansoni TaxID=6183 RepID=UPI0001A628DF|nr:hypothetical protein Smp_175700 [Schistosoma mansoni]|eukprot:XP_018644853.1 hypothetical protein Smp_175700 [Schistosoma mansoni]
MEKLHLKDKITEFLVSNINESSKNSSIRLKLLNSPKDIEIQQGNKRDQCYMNRFYEVFENSSVE